MSDSHNIKQTRSPRFTLSKTGFFRSASNIHASPKDGSKSPKRLSLGNITSQLIGSLSRKSSTTSTLSEKSHVTVKSGISDQDLHDLQQTMSNSLLIGETDTHSTDERIKPTNVVVTSKKSFRSNLSVFIPQEENATTVPNAKTVEESEEHSMKDKIQSMESLPAPPKIAPTTEDTDAAQDDTNKFWLPQLKSVGPLWEILSRALYQAETKILSNYELHGSKTEEEEEDLGIIKKLRSYLHASPRGASEAMEMLGEIFFNPTSLEDLIYILCRLDKSAKWDEEEKRSPKANVLNSAEGSSDEQSWPTHLTIITCFDTLQGCSNYKVREWATKYLWRFLHVCFYQNKLPFDQDAVLHIAHETTEMLESDLEQEDVERPVVMLQHIVEAVAMVWSCKRSMSITSDTSVSTITSGDLTFQRPDTLLHEAFRNSLLGKLMGLECRIRQERSEQGDMPVTGGFALGGKSTQTTDSPKSEYRNNMPSSSLSAYRGYGRTNRIGSPSNSSTSQRLSGFSSSNSERCSSGLSSRHSGQSSLGTAKSNQNGSSNLQMSLKASQLGNGSRMGSKRSSSGISSSASSTKGSRRSQLDHGNIYRNIVTRRSSMTSGSMRKSSFSSVFSAGTVHSFRSSDLLEGALGLGKGHLGSTLASYNFETSEEDETPVNIKTSDEPMSEMVLRCGLQVQDCLTILEIMTDTMCSPAESALDHRKYDYLEPSTCSMLEIKIPELLPVLFGLLVIIGDDTVREQILGCLHSMVHGNSTSARALLNLPLWQTLLFRLLFSVPFDASLRSYAQDKTLDCIVSIFACAMAECLQSTEKIFPHINETESTNYILGDSFFQLAVNSCWGGRSVMFVHSLLCETVDVFRNDINVRENGTRNDEDIWVTSIKCWQNIGVLLRVIETFTLFRPCEAQDDVEEGAEKRRMARAASFVSNPTLHRSASCVSACYLNNKRHREQSQYLRDIQAKWSWTPLLCPCPSEIIMDNITVYDSFKNPSTCTIRRDLDSFEHVEALFASFGGVPDDGKNLVPFGIHIADGHCIDRKLLQSATDLWSDCLRIRKNYPAIEEQTKPWIEFYQRTVNRLYKILELFDRIKSNIDSRVLRRELTSSLIKKYILEGEYFFCMATKSKEFVAQSIEQNNDDSFKSDDAYPKICMNCALPFVPGDGVCDVFSSSTWLYGNGLQPTQCHLNCLTCKTCDKTIKPETEFIVLLSNTSKSSLDLEEHKSALEENSFKYEIYCLEHFDSANTGFSFSMTPGVTRTETVSEVNTMESRDVSQQNVTNDNVQLEDTTNPIVNCWYYIDGKGERNGPVSGEQMIHLLNCKELDGNTLVWRPYLENWITLSQLEQSDII